MNPAPFQTELTPEEGLRRFGTGSMVVASEMADMLEAAGFYVVEQDLLDPCSWPRMSGLPFLVVDDVPGLFFSPGEVLGFMDAWAWQD